MSDLLARLRALRGEGSEAETNAASVPPSVPERSERAWAVEAASLQARVMQTAGAVHFVRTERRPLGARHGRAELGNDTVHPWLERWAGAPVVPRRAEGRVLYLDTETTGLAGGTGTYVFLVGLGWHDEQGFVVEQLLLPGPEHERAWLDALAARLMGARTLVSYNGASFDLPLLRTRFAVHGVADPMQGAVHLDLLPLARRWWRGSLPDCTLGTVERSILGAVRSHEDVPGAEVPLRYRTYLRTWNADPLRGVVSHNVEDIVALAALRHRLERALHDDVGVVAHDAREEHGVGRWLEAIGERTAARARYERVAHLLEEASWDAARLARRDGDRNRARELWRELAVRGDPRAWIELAKLHEHHDRDLAAARMAVREARACGGGSLDDLDLREQRLVRKERGEGA